MKETIIIGGRTNKTTTTLKEILEKKEKEEFAIAELEKIKERISKKCGYNVCCDVINDRISELKGE